MTPERFGRYEVVRVLGEGAMGAVYEARDAALGRDVAIKVMRPAAGVAHELFRARFEAEARALAAVHHRGVVAIHDVGWDGDVPYLVMERVPGGSLKERIAGGALAADEVRALGVQLCDALAAAHTAGVLHRDVKPANVLGDGHDWKLADFGIAHVPGSELTMTGQFLGTPAYASPEALGEGVHSPAGDVWGLGATLYAAACGAPPFEGSLGAAASTAYVPIARRAPGLPASLAAAIDAALARDPARRPSVGELRAMLAGERARVPIAVAAALPWGRAWWPAIAGGAIVLVGVIALAARGGGDRDRDRDHEAPAPVVIAPPSADDSDPVVSVDPATGALRIDSARLLDGRDDKDAKKIADAVRDATGGHLDPAIDKLDDLLEEHPGDAQLVSLRDALAQLRAQGGGEPGRPGPPGHGKHKHGPKDD